MGSSSFIIFNNNQIIKAKGVSRTVCQTDNRMVNEETRHLELRLQSAANKEQKTEMLRRKKTAERSEGNSNSTWSSKSAPGLLKKNLHKRDK